MRSPATLSNRVMNSRQLASNTCFKWILSGRYLCLLYLWSSTTLSAIVELGREAGYFFGSARNFADPSADEVALIHYNTTSLDVAQSDTIWWSHGSASAKTRFLRSHILDLAFCGQKTYLLQKSLIFKIVFARESRFWLFLGFSGICSNVVID